MNEFGREPEALVAEELRAVEAVLRSGWWILGEEVRAFEKEWGAACGARYAVGVASGLDALEIGLRAIGVGPGDEVVTTPVTAFATALAILRAGAQPVLADVDADTAMLDPESVRACFSKRTRAVVLVHLYGQAAPLRRFSALCAEAGVSLVEDCAQAHGARSEGTPVGTAGVVAGWSFYPTKNLGAVGDAGALTTDTEAMAEHARRLRNYGQSERYRHPEAGMNSRLDELQAALLRVRLRRLQDWISARRRVARAYAARINNERVHPLPMPKDAASHTHHLFVVKCDARDALAQFLKEKGVETLIHYPVPVHHQEAAKGMRLAPGGLPRAEAHARSCLSLPCHPHLTDEEIDRVVEAVNAF
jgi:dTDP-4-amino-4,6-dideoxygalactose transaminase